jgi:hypothetical protein
MREDQKLADGEAVAADIMGQLEISAADLIDCAYIDLLRAERMQ